MRMKEGTIIGLIAGTAIGIAIGSFLSSEDGKQFRRDVKDKVSEHLKNLYAVKYRNTRSKQRAKCFYREKDPGSF